MEAEADTDAALAESHSQAATCLAHFFDGLRSENILFRRSTKRRYRATNLLLGPEQDNSIFAVLAANCNDLSVIVNAQCLEELPLGFRTQAIVQIAQAIVAVDETVKGFISLRQGAPNDLTSIVEIAGNTE